MVDIAQVQKSVLPDGASTEAKQDTGNTSLASIDGKSPTLVGGRVPVDGSGVTQPVSGSVTATISGIPSVSISGTPSVTISGTPTVSVSSSALPTGSATSSNQMTEISSLNSIDAKLPTTLGQKTSAQSLAIVVASDQSAIPVTGTVVVSSLPGSPSQEHTTAGSPNAARLTDGTAFYAAAKSGDNLGADLRVASAAVSNANPVPISDANGSITIDGTVSISGAVAVTGPLTDTQLRATPVPISGTVSAGQSGTWDINNVSGTISLPTGAATAAKQPALGTAGSPSVDVLTIQGNAASTPVPISGTVTSTVSGTVSVSGVVAAGTPSDASANPNSIGIQTYPLVYSSAGLSWIRQRGDTFGTWVQGPVSADATQGNERPVQIGVSDGSKIRRALGVPSGAQVMVMDPSHCGPFGDLIAEGKTAVVTRSWRLNALIGQLDQVVSQANGATVTIDTRRLRLRSGTTSGANATYQSAQIAQYREGQGFIFRWTTIFTTGVVSSTQWLGWGNANDGIFVGYTGTSFSILHRINGSDAAVTSQSSWNGDKVNGAGASGMTLDPTKGNVWAAHVPYLGYGNIRIFVQDSTTGQWILVHTIRYANANTALEFSDPGFRLYGSVISSGSTTDLSAYCGSAAAFVVGKVTDRGQQWAENNTVSGLNGTAAIMSIRCATTVNTFPNTQPVRIRQIACGSDNGNTTTTFVAITGTTLGGTPAFAIFTGKSGSTADNGVTLTSADTVGTVDKAGTTITGGDPIWNTATSRNTPASLGQINEEDMEIFIWPGQTLTVYATTGAASNVYCAMNGTVG